MDGETERSESLKNETPAFVTSGFQLLVSYVESYGWLLLIAACILAYVYQKYKPQYLKWKQTQDDRHEAELRKKNPDHSHNMQISMEQARMRMQEKVSAEAEIKRAKDAELAEKKRQEKIQEWENHKQGKGYHSKSKVVKDDTQEATGVLKSKRSNDFRPAYNPLGGGGGGSSGYRPSRNTGRSGGG